MFTIQQRIAIAELLTFGHGMVGSTNEGVRVMGAILLERAAGIVTGDVIPEPLSDVEIMAFADWWKADASHEKGLVQDTVRDVMGDASSATRKH